MTDSESNITKTQPIPEKRVKGADAVAEVHCKKSGLKLRSKKLWFAFITVFISGMAIGAVCVITIMHGKIKRHGGGPPPEMIKMRIISHMSKELNLSSDQKEKAKKIITAMSTKLFEIRKAQQPEIQEVVKLSFSNIEKILNKEQKIQFNKMYKQIGRASKRKNKGSRFGFDG